MVVGGLGMLSIATAYVHREHEQLLKIGRVKVKIKFEMIREKENLLIELGLSFSSLLIENCLRCGPDWPYFNMTAFPVSSYRINFIN